MGGAGGLGAVVLLLVGAYFGVDLRPLLEGGGAPPAVTQGAPGGPNAIDDDAEAFVATILAETEAVWGTVFQAAGRRYEEPVLVLYAQGTTSACGTADAAMGPFYCPGDRRVYLDTDFFDVLVRQMNAGGDFANAYVIAHEVGHHVQHLVGTLEQVHTARARRGQADGNALLVRLELQADCYAGLWAHHARQRLRVTEADIRQALATAARIGDDALQRAAGRQVVPDSFTHGTSEQRQRWFFAGYQSGDPAACDTFAATRL
jgi:predicted metalloprotease